MKNNKPNAWRATEKNYLLKKKVVRKHGEAIKGEQRQRMTRGAGHSNRTKENAFKQH